MTDGSVWKSNLMNSCGPAWPGMGVVFVQASALKRSVPEAGAMIPSVSVGDETGGLLLTNSRVLTSMRFGDAIVVSLVPGLIQPLNPEGQPASDLLAGRIAKFAAEMSDVTGSSEAIRPQTLNFLCQLFPTGGCCTLTNVRCCGV